MVLCPLQSLAVLLLSSSSKCLPFFVLWHVFINFSEFYPSYQCKDPLLQVDSAVIVGIVAFVIAALAGTSDIADVAASMPAYAPEIVVASSSSFQTGQLSHPHPELHF